MRHHPSNRGAPRARSAEVRRRRIAGVVLLGGALATSAAAAAPRDPAQASRWAYRAIIRARGGTFVSFPGVVLQSGLTDCGPAALATLLRSLGGSPPSLDSIAALAGTGAHGTTFAGLARAARLLGLDVELRRLDPAVPAALDTPVLAWVDEGHFVTVVPGPAGSVLVLDPQTGPYRIRAEALQRFWAGEALLPRPLRASADAAGDPWIEGGSP